MVDLPIPAIHATASLTQKPNNAYNFVGAKYPSLVVDYQEGLNRGTRWNVTGTILWLFGWVGVLGFVSQLPFFKTAIKSMSSPTNTEQFCFLQVIWDLNHLLLHHLFLSSFFHLFHLLPPLRPHLHPHPPHLHQFLHHVQILLPH